MPDERQAQPAHGIVAGVGQRPTLGRTRLQAAKRCTVVLPRPVSDSSMLQVTNAAAVGRQPCEIQAACVKHGAETLARHAHPRIAHHRGPQGDCRTLLRRCRGCGSRRCWRWSSLRWWCHRPHPQPRLQSSSHQQQQRRDGQGIPTHVRVETPPALRSALSDARRSPPRGRARPSKEFEFRRQRNLRGGSASRAIYQVSTVFSVFLDRCYMFYHTWSQSVHCICKSRHAPGARPPPASRLVGVRRVS